MFSIQSRTHLLSLPWWLAQVSMLQWQYTKVNTDSIHTLHTGPQAHISKYTHTARERYELHLLQC